MGFSINTITVNGNLTRDPELRTTNSGASVCAMRIAHNSRRKDASDQWVDVPNYFDVTIWRGQGEWLAKNLSKGDGVVVQGELRWREWQDTNGNSRQAVDINAYNVVPVPRGDSSRSSSRSTYSEDVPIDTAGLSSPSVQASDDDIPF